MSRSRSLIEAVRRHSESKPNAVAYGSISPTGDIDISLTYRELVERSGAIASRLSKVCRPGDRAILLFHGGPDFVVAFLGCLMAGVIAVPGYPVRESGATARVSRNFDRLVSIIDDAQPVVALTHQRVVERRAELAEVSPAFSGLAWLAVEPIAAAQTPPEFAGAPADIAFLQYTSGSTANPKGVMVSHANLCSLFEDMNTSCGHDDASVMVTWIPVYHDMGLIYGTLLPLYFGFPVYSLLPAAVLQQPVRWLQAISRFRGTHSAAPNFAFELCVERVTQAAKAALDLSSWKVCINGAETVRPRTLERFAQAFAQCGVKHDVIRAGYGLAECTLKVTSVAAGEPAQSIWLDAAAYEQGRVVAVREMTGTTSARTFQSCGWTHIGADIRIVDPSTRVACDEDSTGEIWVSSTSVAQGYWNQPEATMATMQARLANGEGPFLRTGDIGFVIDRALFVAGRVKDLIIIRGRNLHPQDVESTAEAAHPSVRLGRCGAFAVDTDDGEGLVLVAEVERTERHGFDADAAFRALREAIAREHEVQLHDAVFVRTGTFPLTSSGKVQRQTVRREYRAGALDIVARAAAASDADRVAAERFQEHLSTVRGWLTDFVADRLRIPATQVSSGHSFASLGLDSLDLFELTGTLEERLSRVLPATVVLDYPDIDRLSRYLAEHTS
ncbi:AMP-binding protein [Pararobbsia silviterrae]|uniref:AMP-dependent synthetase n=1 Tax=Pararobbsia silviterrae TaxID=1792498 RepID=A0A494Y170_9BURK|nr:AMP-binding protein [Pararobbsia silviterrae]RKP53605.1 AMP-dependent synthetase [Pararobbsia silviterrae]